MPRNILIADDHYIVRMGLEIIVKEIFGLNTSVDYAENDIEIVEKINQKKYELLISDINMSENNTISAIEQVLLLQPSLKILIISIWPAAVYAPIYRKSGVYGYVSKNDGEEKIKNALKNIHLNKKYFPDSTLFERKNIVSNPFLDLSSRESEVAALMLQGLNLTEIGNILHISSYTASTYKKRVFKKLKIDSVIDLNSLSIKFSETANNVLS